MTKQCPNCSREFIEQHDTAFYCEDCGWFREVDGRWRSCPEPVTVEEPDPIKDEPVIEEPDDRPPSGDDGRLDPNVRSYLGGLVTVEEVEDEDEEN